VVEHPELGRLEWDGEAWLGTLTVGPHADVQVAFFSTQREVVGADHLAAFLRSYGRLAPLIGARLRLLVQEHQELLGPQALNEVERNFDSECVLDSIWVDGSGALELHYTLGKVWPDAALRLRVQGDSVEAVGLDD